MSNEEAFYNDLLILFSKMVLGSLILLVIVAIWQRKYWNKPLKVFVAYKVFSIFFNLIVQGFVWAANNYYPTFKPWLDYFEIYNTNFLEILFYLNDFIFLGWFYYLLLGNRPIGKWIRRVSWILIVAVLLNYFFIEGHNVYGVFNPTMDAIFVFGVAAFYLWYLFRLHLTLPIHKNPYFWISFGLIVPHLIGFFLFMIGDVTYDENFKLFVIISIVKNSFLILGQILMAIGYLYARYAKYIPVPEEGNISSSES